MARLVLHGRYVVTDPRNLPGPGMIEDGFVLAENDRVVETGRWGDLWPRLGDTPVLGGPSHMVVPGFVNAHHHGRGLSAGQLGVHDGPLETWLLDFFAMPPLDVYADTLHANLKMIRSGITTVLHSAYAREWGRLEEETEAALRAYRDCGLRVSYAVGFEDCMSLTYWQDDAFLTTVPAELAADARRLFCPAGATAVERYLDYVDVLEQKQHGNPQIRILFGPTWHPWCSPDFLKKVAAHAGTGSTGIHIHALESPLEAERSRRHYGEELSAFFQRANLTGTSNSLAHGTHMSPEDIARCAETGTSVCHNPSSNLRLRNGVAPIAAMLKAGVNVALGMDSWSLAGAENLCQEARLALALQQGNIATRFETAPDAFDALRMMTCNGGAPTGFGNAVGRLEPGAFADAVLFDFDRLIWPYLAPDVHPVEALIAFAEPHCIDHVVCAGIPILKAGAFTVVDERRVGEAVAEVARRGPSTDFVAFRRCVDELQPYLVAFYGAAPARRS
jgi:cytosine/adenosine deaminase-related metal-dependent hydrolase